MMPIFLALGAGTVPAVEPWCWHWRYPLFGPILILDSWTAWWGPMRKMSFEAARSAKSEGVCGSHSPVSKPVPATKFAIFIFCTVERNTNRLSLIIRIQSGSAGTVGQHCARTATARLPWAARPAMHDVGTTPGGHRARPRGPQSVWATAPCRPSGGLGAMLRTWHGPGPGRRPPCPAAALSVDTCATVRAGDRPVPPVPLDQCTSDRSLPRGTPLSTHSFDTSSGPAGPTHLIDMQPEQQLISPAPGPRHEYRRRPTVAAGPSESRHECARSLLS